MKPGRFHGGKAKVTGWLPFQSLRSKLIFSFLLAVLAGGLASSIIGTRMVGNTIIGEAQKKGRQDLMSGGMIYQEKLDRIRDVLHLTAPRDLILRALWGRNAEIPRRELESVRRGDTDSRFSPS